MVSPVVNISTGLNKLAKQISHNGPVGATAWKAAWKAGSERFSSKLGPGPGTQTKWPPALYPDISARSLERLQNATRPRVRGLGAAFVN